MGKDDLYECVRIVGALSSVDTTQTDEDLNVQRDKWWQSLASSRI